MDIENAFNKSIYPFMTKIFNKVGIDRYFYCIVKIHPSNKNPCHF